MQEKKKGKREGWTRKTKMTKMINMTNKERALSKDFPPALLVECSKQDRRVHIVYSVLVSLPCLPFKSLPPDVSCGDVRTSPHE